MRMLLRLSVAVISGLLLWTAADKVLHWHAFLDVLSNYPLVPPSMIPAVAGGVVAGEVYVGVSLWPAKLRRRALAAASVAFGGFAAAVGLLYATRGAVPCGCALSPLTLHAGPEHIVLNVLLAALAFTVCKLDDGPDGVTTSGLSGKRHGALFPLQLPTHLPKGVCHETPENRAPRAPASVDARDDCDHRTR